MPRISEFFGIVIYMYFKDHSPPHFHAIYAEYEAEIGISPIQILDGGLPKRVQSLVFEWAAIHQVVLQKNWEWARAGNPLQHIPPLE